MPVGAPDFGTCAGLDSECCRFLPYDAMCFSVCARASLTALCLRLLPGAAQRMAPRVRPGVQQPVAAGPRGHPGRPGARVLMPRRDGEVHVQVRGRRVPAELLCVVTVPRGHQRRILVRPAVLAARVRCAVPSRQDTAVCQVIPDLPGAHTPLRVQALRQVRGRGGSASVALCGQAPPCAANVRKDRRPPRQEQLRKSAAHRRPSGAPALSSARCEQMSCPEHGEIEARPLGVTSRQLSI